MAPLPWFTMVVMAKKKGSRRSSKPSSGNTRSGGNPAGRPLSPRPQRSPQGPSSDARRALERRSIGPLSVLHRMPRWLIPIIMAVLMLLGLFIPYAWAGIFILAVAAFLGWLLALSWPVITPGSRVFRLIVIAVVAFVGVLRLTGRG